MDFANNFSTSDDLVWLQDFFAKYPAMAHINNFACIRVIVDTNAVFEAILWSLRKATKPEARPALLEILEAHAINCYAPTFLREEIVSTVSERAERYGYSVEIALEIWRRYEKNIHLIDVGGPEQPQNGFGDPKDVPYLKLQEVLSIPIVSSDQDIEDMGGFSIPSTVFISIRAYSRESATVMKINAMGMFATTVPLVAVSKALAFIKQPLSVAMEKIPAWVWSVAILLVLTLTLNPASRKWFLDKTRNTTTAMRRTISEFLVTMQPVFEEHSRAHFVANQHLTEIKEFGVVCQE